MVLSTYLHIELPFPQAIELIPTSPANGRVTCENWGFASGDLRPWLLKGWLLYGPLLPLTAAEHVGPTYSFALQQELPFVCRHII